MLIINFTIRKLNKYNFNQIIKININTNGANQHCMPPNRCTERASSVVVLPKITNHEENHVQLNWETA